MSFKNLIHLLILFVLLSSCKHTVEEQLNTAKAYYDNNQFTQAIIIYDRIISDNQGLEITYFNRGLCYYELGKYGRALDDFNKVIHMRSDGDAKHALNKDFIYAGIEAKGQVPYLDALYQRGLTKYYMDSLLSAFNDFKTCIENKYDNESNCYLYLGNIYLKYRDNIKACEMLHKAKASGRMKVDIDNATRWLQTYCK
jgi:tetratricopeptide (TPR) repeat protein